jgi:hypothetical protein
VVRAAEDREVRAAQAQRVRDRVVVLRALDEFPQALIHFGPVAGQQGRLRGADKPCRLGEAGVAPACLGEAVPQCHGVLDVLPYGHAGLPQLVGQRVAVLGSRGHPGAAAGDHPRQVVACGRGAQDDPAALAVAEQPCRPGSHRGLRAEEPQRSGRITRQVVHGRVVPVAR